jgi:two-component system LytT family response regulator
MHVLEQGLDPRRFCRIHRSTIVNVDRIAALEPLFRGDHAVLLKDGTRLKLSRSHRQGLARQLGITI